MKKFKIGDIVHIGKEALAYRIVDPMSEWDISLFLPGVGICGLRRIVNG
jgi:hypothetical protein